MRHHRLKLSPLQEMVVFFFYNIHVVYCSFVCSPVRLCQSLTLRKVSKYEVFSGPYFPVFGPEKTPYLDTFHAVSSQALQTSKYLKQGYTGKYCILLPG